MKKELPPNLYKASFPGALEVSMWLYVVGLFGLVYPKNLGMIFGENSYIQQFLTQYDIAFLVLATFFLIIYSIEYRDRKKNTYVKKFNGKWYRFRKISIKV